MMQRHSHVRSGRTFSALGRMDRIWLRRHASAVQAAQISAKNHVNNEGNHVSFSDGFASEIRAVAAGNGGGVVVYAVGGEPGQ